MGLEPGLQAKHDRNYEICSILQSLHLLLENGDIS